MDDRMLRRENQRGMKLTTNLHDISMKIAIPENVSNIKMSGITMNLTLLLTYAHVYVKTKDRINSISLNCYFTETGLLCSKQISINQNCFCPNGIWSPRKITQRSCLLTKSSSLLQDCKSWWRWEERQSNVGNKKMAKW